MLEQQLVDILEKYFGYNQFRPQQLDIIRPIAQGKDVLAILPTGGGKSLCFQVPGLYLGGTTLVISPLISLMQDQVSNLLNHGVKATFLNSSLEAKEQKLRMEQFSQEAYQFVYIAPEKLFNHQFREICQKIKIPLIAIDEAHCVSVWGHDFRPSYLEIGKFVDITFIKNRPAIAAFTATANLRAQEDIKHFCKLQNPIHIQKSFARDNLKILVNKCFNEHDKILHLLYLLNKHQGELGIIYVLTRLAAVQLANVLNRLRPSCQPIEIYHGGLDKNLRAQIQADFISEKIPVIIATNAFGMGVDQPHVRFVIHAQISSNLENYFQEIGRGGRDGNIARCYAFYTDHDLEVSADFISRNHDLPSSQQKILIYKLKQIIKYLQTKKCRQQFILNYFDEKNAPPCHICDRCLRQKFAYSASLKQQLNAWRHWRHKIAKEQKLIPSSILTDLSLSYFSLIDWRNLTNLKVIPGIGNGFCENYLHLLPQKMEVAINNKNHINHIS